MRMKARRTCTNAFKGSVGGRLFIIKNQHLKNVI